MADKALEAGDNIPLTPKQAEAPPAYTQHPPTTATVVIAPQVTPANVRASGPPPNDYLIMSILTILFCFWPVGIIALIKSIEVRNAVARGDYLGAQTASRSALTLNKVAILIGVISLVLTVVLVIGCQLAWIIPYATASSRYRS